MSKNTIIMVLLVTSWLSCFATDLSYAKIWNYQQITDNDKNDRHPRTDGEGIVWVGYNEMNQYRLMYRDLDDNVNLDLSSGRVSGFFGIPSISHGEIAVRAYDLHETQNYYIYRNNTFKLIFSSPIGSFPPYWGYEPSYGSLDPYINNGQVVFSVWDGNDYEIMSWTDGYLVQITDNLTDDYEPQVYNSKICWTGYGGNEITLEDVFLFSDGTITNISNQHAGKDEDSNIFGDKVVWTGRAYDYNDSLFDIFFYDGQSISYVNYMEGNDFEPAIYNNLIAWHNKNGDSPYRVFIQDGYKIEELKYNDFDAIGPHIFEDKVVFSAYDGTDYEIILATYTSGSYTPNNYDGYVRNMVIEGQVACLAHGTGGLKIFDVSEKTNPILLSSLQDLGDVFDIAKKGDAIYLACRENGIYVIDIQDIQNPLIVSILPTNDKATKLHINDNKLFIGDKSGDLLIYDISYPFEPQLLINKQLPGHAYGVDTINGYAVVANYYMGISILYINNYENPEIVGSLAGIGKVWDVTIKGDYAFLSVWEEGIKVVNIEDKSSPILISTLELPVTNIENGWKPPFSISIVGNTAFVGVGLEGVFAIDITNPENPAIIERYDTFGFAWGTEIKDNYLYVSNSNNGFKIFDLLWLTNY